MLIPNLRISMGWSSVILNPLENLVSPTDNSCQPTLLRYGIVYYVHSYNIWSVHFANVGHGGYRNETFNISFEEIKIRFFRDFLLPLLWSASVDLEM